MLPWKATRWTCTLLLLLPLLHFGSLLVRDNATMRNLSPSTWQAELDAYIHADAQQPLPEAPLVAVGGRRLAGWHKISAASSPYALLSRPLGQAIIEDITHYRERLINFYRPSGVILLPEPSELRGRASKTAEQFSQSVLSLVEQSRSGGQYSSFYVFCPLVTPRYPQDRQVIEQVTTLLEAAAREHPQLYIIDPNPVLATAAGQPDPDNFWSDGVQLSERGYARLSVLLQQALAEHPPAQVLTSNAPTSL